MSFSSGHARTLNAVVLALCFASVACAGSTQPSTPSADLAQRSVTSGGITYSFVVFAPTSYKASTAMPAILLIHGAGGNGPEMLSVWQSYAEAHGIILVAPTLDLSAEAEVNVPTVFPMIMDSVRGEWSVDPKSIYVFGYSAGGYFAYDAALLNSTYFAAAGIFASVIQPDYDGIVQQAARKTSIAIYIGDHDQYFSLAQARRTRDLLEANGMDVHYVEMKNQDHNYSAAAGFVNADAWQYMSAHKLP